MAFFDTDIILADDSYLFNAHSYVSLHPYTLLFIFLLLNCQYK